MFSSCSSLSSISVVGLSGVSSTSSRGSMLNLLTLPDLGLTVIGLDPTLELGPLEFLQVSNLFL